eukprot:351096-Prymnesium_polylepis.1
MRERLSRAVCLLAILENARGVTAKRRGRDHSKIRGRDSGRDALARPIALRRTRRFLGYGPEQNIAPAKTSREEGEGRGREGEKDGQRVVGLLEHCVEPLHTNRPGGTSDADTRDRRTRHRGTTTDANAEGR